MAVPIRRRGENGLNAWPGYVDALSTLLMVIIFVLLVFILAQGFLSAVLSGSHSTINRLNKEIAALSSVLSLEKTSAARLEASVATLNAQLTQARKSAEALKGKLSASTVAERKTTETAAALVAERDQLTAALADAELRARAAEAQIASLEQELAQEAARHEEAARAAATGLAVAEEKQAKIAAALAATRAEAADLAKKLVVAQAELKMRATALQGAEQLSAQDAAQIAFLNEQISQLRAQLSSVAGALGIAEEQNKAKNVQIADLGRKLNTALAARVQTLEAYRSEFFGRLRQVLAGQSNIRVVGDRFVFQSDVLFPLDSATLTPAGMAEIDKVATTLKRIMPQIPHGLHWVLNVEGYTDSQPITGGPYQSNWELSVARALAVVKWLTVFGIPSNRLAATGYGQYHPVDPRPTPEGFARNRRIEFRLTNY